MKSRVLSTEQVALVTGGTSGIGLETAVGIAHAGARVVIVGRDARGTEAVEQIAGRTRAGAASFLAADFSTRTGVNALVRAYCSSHDRLDILVNNAGGMFWTRELTADGFERHWGLNHLAYVHLTLALWPLLKHATPSRVVNVSSDQHNRGSMAFATSKRSAATG